MNNNEKKTPTHADELFNTMGNFPVEGVGKIVSGTALSAVLADHLKKRGVQDFMGATMISVGRDRDRVHVVLTFEIDNKNKDREVDSILDFSTGDDRIPRDLFEKIKHLFVPERFDSSTGEGRVNGKWGKYLMVTIYDISAIFKTIFMVDNFHELDILKVDEREKEIYVHCYKRIVSGRSRGPSKSITDQVMNIVKKRD